MYARSNKALNSYFYVLLIINGNLIFVSPVRMGFFWKTKIIFFLFSLIQVGAVTEALLGNIGGGPYDSILNISFDDLFGKNGLLPIRVLPVNYPPVEETVTFHCLRPWVFCVWFKNLESEQGELSTRRHSLKEFYWLKFTFIVLHKCAIERKNPLPKSGFLK